MRFVRFCLVGASGMLLQMMITYFFTEILKIYYIFSMGVAIILVTLWNYLLNSRWTFRC